MRSRLAAMIGLGVVAMGMVTVATSPQPAAGQPAGQDAVARVTDSPDYPRGYRRWTHVASGYLGPESPGYRHFGGIHNIYANERAVAGLAQGRYQDGAVLVWDLFEEKPQQGSLFQGPRRKLDVMVKDRARFPASDGWGYFEFRGDSRSELSVTPETGTFCHDCHRSRSARDFVFSVWRE